ncbi:lipase family protein [Sphingobacterium chungjuense]|uniref:lipase family protein n=1 Tax=Sphingobacterium chungjuense TaxID=2675553 RepID=UPI001407AF95|nr:lipase family protein [Sphingobacterium chungjuense]
MQKIVNFIHPQAYYFAFSLIHKMMHPQHFLFAFIPAILLFFGHVNESSAQHKGLLPGFDAIECEEILKLNKALLDTVSDNKFEDMLAGYSMYYRSPSVGLDNRADVWIRNDSTVVLIIRGTTRKQESILADFYCAMIPASGSIQMQKGHDFSYTLARDDRAAVHAGFLIGFVYLADHLENTLQQLYAAGYRQYIVGGHSQGGALSYYFSAWLMQKREHGEMKDISVKTYASAAPKMGNRYFAYDYDNANRSEWSFSIVNTADAIPEMPLTTQQLDIDMNEPNPIVGLYTRIDNLPFFKRFFLKRSFNIMKKRAKKSSDAYQKYLGKYTGRFITRFLPELKIPEPVKTTYFQRPGVPIILSANKAYSDFFADNARYFHHGIDTYRFLLRQYYDGLDEYAPFVKR